MKKLLLLGMVAFAPDVVGSDTLKTLPTVAVKVSYGHFPFKRWVDATMGEKAAWGLTGLVSAGVCCASFKAFMATQDATEEEIYQRLLVASAISTVVCAVRVYRA